MNGPLNGGELMTRFVQGMDRQQTTLLPECLDDLIDESNPVRAVDVFRRSARSSRAGV